MKWLFYLLALANAGALGLQYWYLAPPEPPRGVADVRSQPGGPRLVLVSELERPPQARATPRPVETRPPEPDKQPEPAQPPSPVCYRISGLPDEQQADALAARLRRQNAEIRGRHLQQEVETRYWVSLPPFPSREAAAPTMRRLKRGGIADYYFVTAEPNRNAISLGVFSNPKGAERRRAQVARLGLKPRVEPVEAPKKVYALTLALTPGDSLDRLDFGVWEVQAEETVCP
jgi:hypothetical protein